LARLFQFASMCMNIRSQEAVGGDGGAAQAHLMRITGYRRPLLSRVDFVRPFADDAANRQSAPFERVFQKRPPVFEGGVIRAHRRELANHSPKSGRKNPCNSVPAMVVDRNELALQEEDLVLPE
jgi:hypothetical protein